MSSEDKEQGILDAYIAQRAYNRVLRDQMNMAVNPMMNAAAQGSVFGQAYSNQSQIGGRRIEQMFDHNRQINVTIVNADNGFILVAKPEYPGTDRVLVASTIEELRDLITSEMVTRKMEK